MKEMIKPVLIGALATVIGLIAYDMFVKGLVGGNYDSSSSNYELDENNRIMKVA